MAVMREAWTDERLDDLNGKVDRGFDQVDQRFERVDQRFDQVERRFEQVDQRFNQLDQRLDGLQQTLILGFAAMSASIVGALLLVPH